MKTIRNQVNYPKNLQVPTYRKALGPVLIHFIKRLKRTTKKTTNKVQLNFVRKRCQNRQAIFWPSK